MEQKMENEKIAWADVLAVDNPWTTCYPIVQDAAKLILEALPSGKTIATDQLVELIWPEKNCRGPAIMVQRPRLYRALDALAKHGLASYVSHEEDTTSYWAQRTGRVIKRKRWHAPDPSQPNGHLSDATDGVSMMARMATHEDRLSILEKRIAAIEEQLLQPAS